MISEKMWIFAAGILVGVGIECLAKSGVGEKVAEVIESKGRELKKNVSKASEKAKQVAENIVEEAR